MSRRPLDAYFTPAWQTRALLHHQPIDGVILEPCAGDGSITRVLTEDNLSRRVITNDLDPNTDSDLHLDAAGDELYQAVAQLYGGVDWVVTNPPYTMPTCTEIVEHALRYARKGVAMLLRISFREPTPKKNPRGPFLEANPLSRLLTLPRYSYTQNGKSDSATTEWAVWLKDPKLRAQNLPAILSLHKANITFEKNLRLCA